MWKDVDHIGIAVKSLKNSNHLFSKLFNQQAYKEEKVEAEGVTTSFFRLGTTKIELLEGHKDSIIRKYIEKRGEGIHHIAFDVKDIHAEMERLEREGFKLINPVPEKGADNKLVCFVHPKSSNGVLIELCQEIK